MVQFEVATAYLITVPRMGRGTADGCKTLKKKTHPILVGAQGYQTLPYHCTVPRMGRGTADGCKTFFKTHPILVGAQGYQTFPLYKIERCLILTPRVHHRAIWVC